MLYANLYLYDDTGNYVSHVCAGSPNQAEALRAEIADNMPDGYMLVIEPVPVTRTPSLHFALAAWHINSGRAARGPVFPSAGAFLEWPFSLWGKQS